MIKIAESEGISVSTSPGFSVTFTPVAISYFFQQSPRGFGGNDRRPCIRVLPMCQGSTKHAPRYLVFLTTALGSM